MLQKIFKKKTTNAFIICPTPVPFLFVLLSNEYNSDKMFYKIFILALLFHTNQIVLTKPNNIQYLTEVFFSNLQKDPYIQGITKYNYIKFYN